MTIDQKALTYAAYALLACASACATAHRSGGEGETVSQQSLSSVHSNTGVARILPADLGPVQGATALDAVRQLRPEFLRVTTRRASTTTDSPAVSVYENGKFLGSAEMLAGIPLGILVEVRRIEPVEAMIRFGSTCPCDGGVILVRTQP